MILRNKQISIGSDEISLQVSFGQADVRRILKDTVALFYWKGNDRLLRLHVEEPKPETEFRELIEHHPSFFGFPEKWRAELSRWAFASALRQNLIKKSATSELYYIGTKILPHKIGRPSKEQPEQ